MTATGTVPDLELVVLLASDGTTIGSAPKRTVHGADTPLHLAFSCHVRNADGEVLVTRRALTKRTWPGVWSNSFCGHPEPGEPLEAAVRRRARQELGIGLGSIEAALPDFRYRAVDAGGVVENEVCPVFLAETGDAIEADRSEIDQWAWVRPGDLEAAVAAAPFAFSPWLVLQLPLLAARAAATGRAG